jgi:hypothetical protein
MEFFADAIVRLRTGAPHRGATIRFPEDPFGAKREEGEGGATRCRQSGRELRRMGIKTKKPALGAGFSNSECKTGLSRRAGPA